MTSISFGQAIGASALALVPATLAAVTINSLHHPARGSQSGTMLDLGMRTVTGVGAVGSLAAGAGLVAMASSGTGSMVGRMGRGAMVAGAFVGASVLLYSLMERGREAGRIE